MRLLRELTAAHVRAQVDRGACLLVPAGCLECHGNHLPVGTDTVIAEAVADRVGGIVAPTIDYGPTGYAVSGPDLGTVDVAAEAFYAYVKAALAGLVRLRFRAVFIVVHHQGFSGPEAAAFHFAGAALFNELHRARGDGWWGEHPPVPTPPVRVIPTIPPDLQDRVRGDHAGRTETALMLHVAPDAVDLSALRPGDHWYAWQPGQESSSATAELGRSLFEMMASSVSDEILRLL